MLLLILDLPMARKVQLGQMALLVLSVLYLLLVQWDR